MANVNIRIDDQLKSDVEAVLSEIGLNMTSAITIFAKAIIRENGIPFELKADPFYSKQNLRHLEESILQIGEGKTVEHGLLEEE